MESNRAMTKSAGEAEDRGEWKSRECARFECEARKNEPREWPIPTRGTPVTTPDRNGRASLRPLWLTWYSIAICRLRDTLAEHHQSQSDSLEKKGNDMAVTCFVVDVETDGPDTSRHSMFWFGAVVLTEALDETFEGRMCPIHDTYHERALAVSGRTRDEIRAWPDPRVVMPCFAHWVRTHTRPGTTPQIWSDNNGFDLKWLTLYLDRFSDSPDLLGHSSRNLSDRHKGLVEGARFAGSALPQRIERSFAELQITPHDHNPLNDARGNAEALLALRTYGLRIKVH